MLVLRLALFPGLQCGLAIGCMGVRIETARTLLCASAAYPKVRFLVLVDAIPSVTAYSSILSNVCVTRITVDIPLCDLSDSILISFVIVPEVVFILLLITLLFA